MQLVFSADAHVLEAAISSIKQSQNLFINTVHTAISIKVVPEQSGKVEYEREKLAGSDD